MSAPWIKFYPRDWRGDQALRVVSLAARGLWMEMLCVMHEASPYGHLLVGGQPLSCAALARLVGSSEGEVQAMLVELSEAGVSRQTRRGVVYSKRMIADQERSEVGRKAKLEAIEKSKGNPLPSRSPSRPPTTQKPEARGKVEAQVGASTLPEAKNDFVGPKEVREAFVKAHGEPWVISYIDPCGWQDVPERALIPATREAATKITREARKTLIAEGLSVIERAA